jgi:hypothetical protein
MLKLLTMNGGNITILQLILASFAGTSGSAIKQISAPKPLLQIGCSNTLLIQEPQNEVSVYFHEYDKGLRCLTLHLINPDLFNHKDLLEGIFNAVTTHEAFIKFGKYKSIIVSAVMYQGMSDVTTTGSSEFNFHHNVLIDQTTTFNQYYNEVGEFVNNKLEYGYGYDVIEYYKVKVWNLDLMKNAKIKLLNKGRIELLGYRSYSTKATQVNVSVLPDISLTNLVARGIETNKKFKKITISPVKLDSTCANFATMDIETMNVNGVQEPVAISTCNSKTSTLFIIDSLLLKTSPDLAVKDLWKKYFDYILKTGDQLVFAHNLGNFDGYLLYKGLVNYFDPTIIDTIIDESKSFISITLNLSEGKIVWKDSLRLFPVKLDLFCEMFGVKGKLIPYDLRFNDLSLFTKPKLWHSFKKYALQDSIALYQALVTAQAIYYNDFKVDITTIYSSATLSLKIFRSKFLSLSIPIPTKDVDEFVREGYYGGGTDYYKAFVTNMKYYDINSLYPNAMKNPMPLNLIKIHNFMNNIKLENFFGYIKVEVTCPKSVARPMLPFKFEGKTIYPTGTWTATYFSEELKAVQMLGYKFKLIKGFEFSKANIFDDYVDHFFNIKLNSTGAQKLIAKLHLNGLYGYFGRKQDLIETVNVNNSSLHKYLSSRIVKEILKINDNYSTLLLSANINHKVLRMLNMACESNIQKSNRIVMSNVAVAAAVTAYARIHMMYYKLLPGTVYTDTDSIFTTDVLPESLVGSSLGQMKDELKGKFIKEGIFLGVKKYGYWYLDDENHKVEASVFAGVERNSLTFNEIIELLKGNTLHKTIDNRFYKSFNSLNISIKSANISIQKSDRKLLVDNNYIPLHIENGYIIRPYDVNGYKFKYLKNKILKYSKFPSL